MNLIACVAGGSVAKPLPSKTIPSFMQAMYLQSTYENCKNDMGVQLDLT